MYIQKLVLGGQWSVVIFGLKRQKISGNHRISEFVIGLDRYTNAWTNQKRDFVLPA